MRAGDKDDPVSVVIERVGIRQGAAALFANLDGAIFVFVLTAFLLPELDGARDSEYGPWLDVGLFTAFVVTSGAWCARLSIRRYEERTQWLLDRAEPTPVQQAAVLKLPMDQSVLSLVPWALAAVFFGSISVAWGNPATHGIRLAVAILLGGFVSVALSFLFIERAMRPLFALALGGRAPERPATLGVRPRLLLTWASGRAYRCWRSPAST